MNLVWKANRGSSKENVSAALKFWSEGLILNQALKTYNIPEEKKPLVMAMPAGDGYAACKTAKMIFSDSMELSFVQHLKSLDSR